MDDTELLAAIGRMVVNAALLEHSVAELVAVTEGLRDEARQERAVEIVSVPGKAMRLFRDLAKQRPDLRRLMEDTAGLLRARHFVAHSVAQQDAVAEGQAALFVLHPTSGEETMITTRQAQDNARMILEGVERIRDTIAAEISNGKPLVPLRSRASAILFRLDWQWRAVRLQHERLMAVSVVRGDSSVAEALREHMQGIADMDFFVTAVRRLLRLAERTRDSGFDSDGELTLAIRIFNSRWRHVIRVRDALEHSEELERRAREGPVLPMRGGGNFTFMWVGGPVDAQQLFESAETLYKAVYKVIEPYMPEATEATSS